MLRTKFLAIAAAAVAVAAPLHAETTPLSAWVSTVNHRIQNVMERSSDTLPTGSATVTFKRAANGDAVNVTTNARTSVEVGRAVSRAARTLRNLPALPQGVDPATPIRMTMLVGNASKPWEFYAKQTQLLASAQTANEQFAARAGESRLASAEPR